MTTDTKNVMQAGAASRNVTPPVGVAMQGYELRHATAINDPILGSALAVGGDRVEWLLLSIPCSSGSTTQHFPIPPRFEGRASRRT